MIPEEQAEGELNQLNGDLAQDPHNLALLASAFDTALAAGAFESAQLHLSTALALVPDDAHFLHRQATWLAAVGRLNEAVSKQQALCARSPDNAELKLGLASLCFHRQDFVAAAAWLQELQTLGKLPPDAHGLLLNTLHHLGRLDEAIAYGKRHPTALQSYPKAAAAYSLVLVDAERFSEAKTWADHALQFHADDVDASTARGNVALAERDTARAQECLQSAIALRPHDGRVWSALGMVGLVAGQSQVAQAAFVQRVLSLVPGLVDLRMGL